MKRTVSLFPVAAVATAILLWFPVTSGMSITVNYHIETQDLFPSVDRLDLILETDWSVAFDSDNDTIEPGATVEYGVSSSAGQGLISVQWWYNGTLLQENGSQSVPYETPIGEHADIPLYDDGVFSITLTIQASVEASLSMIGPGVVSPSSATWTSWGEETFLVTADDNAQNEERILVSAQTTYSATLVVAFDVVGIETLTSDLVSRSGAGDVAVTNAIDVSAPADDGTTGIPMWIPLAVILLILIIASALILVLIRRRTGPPSPPSR